MNAKELDRLLEKYYSGESTEEEEKTIRESFRGDSVLEGYDAEKEIFRYYQSVARLPEPSDNFEAKILERIDTTGRKGESTPFRAYFLPLLGVAASILIIAGSYIFLRQKNELQDTYSDPKIAYAETMKVLIDVSSKLNHATLALEPVSKINEMETKSFEAITKSSKLIGKNLKNLDYLYESNEKPKTPEKKQ